MTRYDGRFMHPQRQSVTGGGAFKKHCLATQVWTSNDMAAADTFYFGKLPKGAIITGGRLYGGRLASGSSAGCSSLQMSLGLDAICYSTSGTSYGATSMNKGLISSFLLEMNPGPASSVPYKTLNWESGFSVQFGALLQATGPLILQADGNVFAYCETAPNSSSGFCANLNIELDYYTGTYT